MQIVRFLSLITDDDFIVTYFRKHFKTWEESGRPEAWFDPEKLVLEICFETYFYRQLFHNLLDCALAKNLLAVDMSMGLP